MSASRRRERQARQLIVDRAGRDRRVVVDSPERIDDRGRPDCPPDTEARQAVRLGQAAGDDRPVVPPPDRRGLAGSPLGAAVDLRLALLAAVALDLRDRQALDAHAGQRFAHFLDDPKEYVFSILAGTYVWVDNILYADSLAYRGKSSYAGAFFEAFADVVRVEHRRVRYLGESFWAMAQDERIGLYEDAEVAVERLDPADRPRGNGPPPRRPRRRPRRWRSWWMCAACSRCIRRCR